MMLGRSGAMPGPFKHMNRTRKQMADGSFKYYFYAWKGGPPLKGEYGSPEFHASYAEAWASRARRGSDTLQYVLDLYRQSPDFDALAASTKKDYRRHLLTLEREFGDMPLVALEDRRARGEVQAWRDRLAIKSRRQADYAFAVFARTLSWAKNRGIVTVNPCERGGRVYRAERTDRVWTFEDEAAFYASAPKHLHAALALALWTGQRQGDLLALRWQDFDGKTIRLRQSKSRTHVEIPVSPVLQAHLAALREKLPEDDREIAGLTILRTDRDTPWTSSGFRASWRKARIKAGIDGVSFHDLRGTAVTRLAMADCTVPEIATITGHSLKDVGAILDSHYLNRDRLLAEKAIAKLTRFVADQS
jgi:integrase